MKIIDKIIAIGFLLLFSSICQFTYGQFTIREDFMGTVLPTDIKLAGSAMLTKVVNGIDEPNEGYLYLTRDLGSQNGSMYIDIPFPSDKGVFLDFEYKTWGRTIGRGGDGFSVFLFDATKPFRAGASGGSLGYAHSNRAGGSSAGLNGGYIGIGFDEFGNYANSSDGKGGLGQGSFPNRITLRGKVTSTSYSDINSAAMVKSTALPQSIELAYPYPTFSSKPDGRPSDNEYYRRVQIELNQNTAKTGYDIVVRMRTSLTGAFEEVFRTTYNVAPYQTLKVGMAASTGGAMNNHEIRKLLATTPGGVSILKRVDKENVKIGEDITYTLDIDGQNPKPFSVTLEDDFAKILSYVDLQSIEINDFGFSGNKSDKKDDFLRTGKLPITIDRYGQMQIKIKGKVIRYPPDGVIENTAGFNKNDLNDALNRGELAFIDETKISSTVRTMVEKPPYSGPTIIKTVEPKTELEFGDKVTYLLQITSGDIGPVNVDLLDDLQEISKFITIDQINSTSTAATNVVGNLDDFRTTGRLPISFNEEGSITISIAGFVKNRPADGVLINTAYFDENQIKQLLEEQRIIEIDHNQISSSVSSFIKKPIIPYLGPKINKLVDKKQAIIGDRVSYTLDFNSGTIATPYTMSIIDDLTQISKYVFIENISISDNQVIQVTDIEDLRKTGKVEFIVKKQGSATIVIDGIIDAIPASELITNTVSLGWNHLNELVSSGIMTHIDEQEVFSTVQTKVSGNEVEIEDCGCPEGAIVIGKDYPGIGSQIRLGQSNNQYCIVEDLTLQNLIIDNNTLYITNGAKVTALGDLTLGRGLIDICPTGGIDVKGTLTLKEAPYLTGTIVEMRSHSFITTNKFIHLKVGNIFAPTAEIIMKENAVFEVCSTTSISAQKEAPIFLYKGSKYFNAYIIAKGKVSVGGDTTQSLFNDSDRINIIFMDPSSEINNIVMELKPDKSNFCLSSSIDDNCNIWPLGLTGPGTCSEAQVITENSRLSLTKVGKLIEENSEQLKVGDVVEYMFLAKNIGALPIAEVQLVDKKLRDDVLNTTLELQIGQFNLFTASYIITQKDIEYGGIVNQADAYLPKDSIVIKSVDPEPIVPGSIGYPYLEPGSSLENCATCTVTLLPSNAQLEIVKIGILDEQVDSEHDLGVINYLFSITNTGNVNLYNVSLSDSFIPNFTPTIVSGFSSNHLEVGEKVVYSYTYHVQEQDIENEQVENRAKVVANTFLKQDISALSINENGLQEPTVTPLERGLPVLINPHIILKAQE